MKALLLTVAATLLVGVEAAANDGFALLIGVGEYAHLSESEQLKGSANDVAAMRKLLTTRFGFDADTTSSPLWTHSNESSAGLLMMKTGSLPPASLESFPIRIAGQADCRFARFL